MSFSEKTFLGVAGPTAGAGIASAVASLVLPVVPLVVPVLGAIATILSLKLSGALDDPGKIVIKPPAVSALRQEDSAG